MDPAPLLERPGDLVFLIGMIAVCVLFLWFWIPFTIKADRIQKERVAKGLCRSCGEPNPEGTYRCGGCQTLHNTW